MLELKSQLKDHYVLLWHPSTFNGLCFTALVRQFSSTKCTPVKYGSQSTYSRKLNMLLTCSVPQTHHLIKTVYTKMIYADTLITVAVMKYCQEISVKTNYQSFSDVEDRLYNNLTKRFESNKDTDQHGQLPRMISLHCPLEETLVNELQMKTQQRH